MAKVDTVPGRVFRFGLFEADPERNTLSRKGVRIRIQDQPFRTLILLLTNPGQIVSRDELRRRLWPEGTHVDFDGSLNVVLKKLRAAIDDDSDNPRFIETIPRQGYRFIAPVSIEPAQPPPESKVQVGSDSPVASHVGFASLKHVWPWLVAAALILAISVWKYARKQNQTVAAAAPKSIAVLPFSNQGAGPGFDYLRYAIANDLVTDLMHAHSVSVRPFSSTSAFASQAADPVAIARELRVTHVVAGGFLLDGNTLHVNIELVDVGRNQPVWRDELTVSPPRTYFFARETGRASCAGVAASHEHRWRFARTDTCAKE